jgi:hypothetical protein
MCLWTYLDSFFFIFTCQTVLSLPPESSETQASKHNQTSNKFNEYEEPDFALLGTVSYIASVHGQ